jgi:hypothetical protein
LPKYSGAISATDAAAATPQGNRIGATIVLWTVAFLVVVVYGPLSSRVDQASNEPEGRRVA